MSSDKTDVALPLLRQFLLNNKINQFAWIACHFNVFMKLLKLNNKSDNIYILR